MITNANEFLADLHRVLRGAATRADDDVTRTLRLVAYQLKERHSLHYRLSRWRSVDAQDHEFTFRANSNGSYTYLHA
ncbi:hypothetical protein ACRYI5_04175 [Furfurilactobacillus sp. WILCCON 0119]|uniref:hypothetical protein n=1 Tax=Furfurilactobacillus entadae TaxID=2922307 RepID=UPI0035E70D9A